jgi:hypothetical protein
MSVAFGETWSDFGWMDRRMQLFSVQMDVNGTIELRIDFIIPGRR